MKKAHATSLVSLLNPTLCVFFCIQFYAVNSSAQTTYYVSALGDNASDGKSPSTPWKTVSKINSVSVVSGDAILFRCGDEFEGQVDLHQSGVTLGSYGSGQEPIISGGEHLSSWSQIGLFYVTQASATVKNLFVNGVQMTLARYPNSGFLSIASTPTTTTLTATGLSQAPGYWNGGNLRVRTTDWSYETLAISTYDGTTITLAAAPSYRLTVGWGFYLDNVPAALDTPGEWYCDPATNSVYFYPPGGVDPNSLNVIGSVLDYGVNSSQSNITIQGLTLSHQCKAGLHFSGTPNNIRLLSNKVFGVLLNGIELGGTSSSCTIDGNTVEYVNGQGIALESTQNSTVTNNVVKNVGLIPGYGKSGTSGMQGIAVGGSHNFIKANIVDSVGYVGITSGGSECTIVNNIITNVMLRLSDGGAIYTYALNQSTISGNLVINSTGSNDAQPVGAKGSGDGIYMDSRSSNYGNVILDNTVVDVTGVGFIVQSGSYGHTIRGNTFYNHGYAENGYSLLIAHDTTLGYGSNTIKQNIFYLNSDVQPILKMVELVGTSLHPIGVIDSNYYYNPYNIQGAQFGTFAGAWKYYELAGWRMVTGQEGHSRVFPVGDDSLFINKSPTVVTVSLAPYAYLDLDSTSIEGYLTLPAYSSRILIKDGLAHEIPTSAGHENLPAPDQFVLGQNYPNPFNPLTTIKYGLPKDTKVQLLVYDVGGRLVAVVVDTLQARGYHEARFDGTNLASGVYFYTLKAGTFVDTKKFLLLK
jgi:parallel beta-helix repeat protein